MIMRLSSGVSVVLANTGMFSGPVIIASQTCCRSVPMMLGA